MSYAFAVRFYHFAPRNTAARVWSCPRKLHPPCTMTTAANTASSMRATTGDSGGAPDSKLVQYVLLRTDLDWPMGSLVAQGIHAALRATHPADDANIVKYVAEDATQQMTTVVLGAKNEAALHKTAEKLDKVGMRYALWIEQPENIPTALASRPAPRAQLKPLFAGFRLLR